MWKKHWGYMCDNSVQNCVNKINRVTHSDSNSNLNPDVILFDT